MVWPDGSSPRLGLDRVRSFSGRFSWYQRPGLSGSRDVGESKKDKYGPRWLDLIKSKTFLHFK